MKAFWKRTAALLAAGTALLAVGAAPAPQSENVPQPQCKAAYLCDAASGTAVYGKEETKRLPIASMCKIMTLLLSFEAVDSGVLTYDEEIVVSENAAGMGGSQVFLEAGLSYRAEELMETIAVCSANDSCVALAERVAGSEPAFVDRMNERARELGAENTLFSNCTGLPKEPQYSCAKDVALMLRALIGHEKYFEFAHIWLEDFPHPDGRTIRITNTNKLIRQYEGCDGGKTGFTNEAGFCLAATAKRNDTRLVAVVIGAETSKDRFRGITGLFDFCFNTYETRVIAEAGTLDERVEVRGSRMKDVAVELHSPLTAFQKRGEAGDYTVEIEPRDALCAPLKKGDEVGRAALYRDGVEIASSPLFAAEDAPKLTWWDAFRELARLWN